MAVQICQADMQKPDSDDRFVAKELLSLDDSTIDSYLQTWATIRDLGHDRIDWQNVRKRLGTIYEFVHHDSEPPQIELPSKRELIRQMLNACESNHDLHLDIEGTHAFCHEMRQLLKSPEIE